MLQVAFSPKTRNVFWEKDLLSNTATLIKTRGIYGTSIIWLVLGYFHMNCP